MAVSCMHDSIVVTIFQSVRSLSNGSSMTYGGLCSKEVIVIQVAEISSLNPLPPPGRILSTVAYFDNQEPQNENMHF